MQFTTSLWPFSSHLSTAHSRVFSPTFHIQFKAKTPKKIKILVWVLQGLNP